MVPCSRPSYHLWRRDDDDMPGKRCTVGGSVRRRWSNSRHMYRQIAEIHQAFA